MPNLPQLPWQSRVYTCPRQMWEGLGEHRMPVSVGVFGTDRFLSFESYLLKVMDRVVEKLSPGWRIAAAAWASHRLEPPSTPGRLCQGSMHTN